MPFKIVRNDITKVKADVIVNTANPNPICVSGTDLAIYEAAGKGQLLAERTGIGKIARGDIAVTGAYNLKAGDTISLDHDVRLKIETVKDADEKEWIGVFTSSEEMHKGSAGNVQMNQSIESILRLALNWEQVNGIVINPFGKYIQMTKKMIELLINGYEHYENERKSKDDENN